MAEVFVPSTTGEGQGAAQIFQSNPQFADASGIVRGIERGEARIAANQEKEYERQKAESAERRKKINELQELQYAGGSEFLRSVSDSIMDDFRKAVIDNGEDVYEAFSKARVGLERVKNADVATTKLAGIVNKDFDNNLTYDTETNTWKSGSLTPLEMAKKPYDGDDYLDALGEYESEITNYGSNTSNMLYTGLSLDEEFLKLKKAADTSKTTTEELIDGGGTRTTETTELVDEKEIRDALLTNQQLQKSELNNLFLKYNVNTISELEKKLRMTYPDYYKSRVDSFFNKDPKVNIKEELQKKRGGLNFNFNNGRGENERFYFDVQTDLNEPLEKDNGSFTPRTKIRVESKSSNPTQDFTDNGDVFRGSLTAINLDANGKPENIIVGGNEMPYEENKFILEKEYGLTENVINKLSNNSPKERKIEKDAIYYILDGNRLTLDVLESAYGGIVPEGAEKVTEENKDMMEANLPDRTTRETINEREAERRGNNPKVATEEDINNLPD